MKIYDTMRKRVVELKLDKKVRMYVCGITAYDYSHIGHARNIVFFDTLRRFLEYKGHEVIFVQNFTDVDDKIIRRAIELGKTAKEVAEYFINEFWKDAKALNYLGGYHPRVTDYIQKIIDAVKTLVDKGYAYEVDGKFGKDVYFHVPKFEKYGELSGYSLDELNRHRIEPDERKKDVKDFALWKSAKEEDFKAKSFFESPWGKGRPGWHIECSVMSSDILGIPFDIHGGGMDLVFPHHENERAQSYALFGVEPVRYWIHNNFVTINGEKMSKSLGNIVRIREAVEKYGGEVLRFFLLSAHYRSPLDYNEKSIERAKKSYEHLLNSLRNVDMEIAYLKTTGERRSGKIKSYLSEFVAALENDMNTPKAIAVMHEFASELNKNVFEASLEELERAFNEFKTMARILGIFENYRRVPVLGEEELELIRERELARKERDFDKADKIREKFREKGIYLVDTKKGTRWFTSSSF